MGLEQVPGELQALRQWIIWRYETTAQGRPTKVPYSPITGRKAAVDQPSDWADWQTANIALAQSGYSGLGFVLTANDPYTFIDLDDASAKFQGDKLATVTSFQKEVYRRLSATYCEYSPSGKGLHIIVRGAVPTGKRKDAVEVYSSLRYMTMTGNALVPGAPIIDARFDDLMWLWQALGGNDAVTAAPAFAGTQEDIETDQTIIERGFNAVNGERFAKLWYGQWPDMFPSQSEADFALVDMLAFYTSSVPQIKRLFRSSALGQREKAQSDKARVNGLSYTDAMIKRAFDHHPAPVDVAAVREALDRQFGAEGPQPELVAGDVLEDKKAVPAPIGKSPYGRHMPGMLHQIAYFIYEASPRPVTEIALAAAIGLMAGICGRSYNVSGTGLNQYILLLAGTGRGKEAMDTGIGRLMQKVTDVGPGGGGCPGAAEFIGPDDIASGQALVKYLTKSSKSFVTVQGEFDLTLKNFTARHANAALIKLKQVLLKSYSKSGRDQVLKSTIYSDADKNTAPTQAPAITLIGEGTPERLYALLDEGMIQDGLLPRFTIIHYDGIRVRRQKTHRESDPNPQLVKALAALCGQSLMLNQSNQVIDVAFDPAAEQLLDQYDFKIDGIINAARNDVIEQIWNRAHLKAMKLAALLAIGVNPSRPIIDPDQAQYAIDIVNYDTRRLVSKFESGDVGDSESKQIADIRRIIRRYFARPWQDARRYGATQAMHLAGAIPKRMLFMRTANVASYRADRIGATNALNRTIQSLLDGGVIQQLGPIETRIHSAQGAKLYSVVDPHWLDKGADEEDEEAEATASA